MAINLHGTTSNTRTASLSDPVETPPAPRDPNARLAEQIEANLEARRKELGVADELKGIPGLTTLMLVAFGEQGIRTVEDLAGCATDDLCGWIEDTSETPTRHEGVLHRFNVSRAECDAMILHARIKSGWI
jgi:N utilization substance protein A